LPAEKRPGAPFDLSESVFYSGGVSKQPVNPKKIGQTGRYNAQERNIRTKGTIFARIMLPLVKIRNGCCLNPLNRAEKPS
jgi:hypothetical protein